MIVGTAIPAPELKEQITFEEALVKKVPVNKGGEELILSIVRQLQEHVQRPIGAEDGNQIPNTQKC